jgi:membrane-bound metal-dependent hydrolase YbcI (DUF457 family)
MPTPVGHSIIGLGVALACSPDRRLRDIVADRGTLVPALVLASLADTDLLVGLLVYGNAARYHGFFMHSVFFAVAVAGLATVLPWPAVPAWRRFVFALALLLSHPLADMLQSPWGPGLFGGLGVRLLAPVSDTRWSFPISLFLGVEFQNWRQLLSVRSAVVVLLELSCLLPLLLLVDALRGPRTQTVARGRAAYAGADAKSPGQAGGENR